jgi:hypothetical protein
MPFVYSIDVQVTAPAIVSISAGFDFLTNDITLLLKQKSDTIATGEWEVIDPDSFGEMFNLSNGFVDVAVEPGVYTLLVR